MCCFSDEFVFAFSRKGTDCMSAAVTVGYGLFMIVALQYLGLQFFTRNVRNEEVSALHQIFWFVFAGATMLFLIITAVWAGIGPGASLTPRFAGFAKQKKGCFVFVVPSV